MVLHIGSWYPLSPRRESPENEVDCSFRHASFQHTLPSQGNRRSTAGMEDQFYSLMQIITTTE